MSDMTLPGGGDGSVTIREVYQLVQSVRSELMAELGKLEAQVTTQVTVHATEHQRDRDVASARIKWAVTSILTAAGVFVALWGVYVQHWH